MQVVSRDWGSVPRVSHLAMTPLAEEKSGDSFEDGLVGFKGNKPTKLYKQLSSVEHHKE